MRSYLVDNSGAVVKMTRSFGDSSDGTYLVIWNGHGDALALWKVETSGALTLANSYTYTTWGAPTTTPHNGYPDLEFRFVYVGQHDVQWDNNYGLGLYYMHARHYSPTLGRFLQPDPAAVEANYYGYADNSPVTRTDPSGRGPEVLVPVAGCLADLPLCLLLAAGALAVAGTFYIATHPITFPRFCLWNCSGEDSITYAAKTRVSDILKGKRGSIKKAPLPPESPPWSEVEKLTWGQVLGRANRNVPGYRTIKKLLTDRRFNK